MNYTYVMLARRTGMPLSELMTWHPRQIATLAEILEEERWAEKRAANNR